mmetsp:Transcript_1288/g.4227  ORF Transcript_1288/g.4227 Transcript_1288/m.4227 type:complete len:333 (-) Transcript_1288:1900-2898(-)
MPSCACMSWLASVAREARFVAHASTSSPTPIPSSTRRSAMHGAWRRRARGTLDEKRPGIVSTLIRAPLWEAVTEMENTCDVSRSEKFCRKRRSCASRVAGGSFRSSDCTTFRMNPGYCVSWNGGAFIAAWAASFLEEKVRSEKYEKLVNIFLIGDSSSGSENLALHSFPSPESVLHSKRLMRSGDARSSKTHNSVDCFKVALEFNVNREIASSLGSCVLRTHAPLLAEPSMQNQTERAMLTPPRARWSCGCPKCGMAGAGLCIAGNVNPGVVSWQYHTGRPLICLFDIRRNICGAAPSFSKTRVSGAPRRSGSFSSNISTYLRRVSLYVICA